MSLIQAKLIQAAGKGDLNLVRELVASGKASVSKKNKVGW